MRDSICIVGHDWQLVQYVKGQVSSLVDQPLPLESLHVKKDSDFKEGALLVPKVNILCHIIKSILNLFGSHVVSSSELQM